jgi:hypothetical protein
MMSFMLVYRVSGLRTRRSQQKSPIAGIFNAKAHKLDRRQIATAGAQNQGFP